jgi:PAS domain S-box-containing protein
MSIRVKLIIILVVFAIVPAIIFGAWSYIEARNSLLTVRMAQLNSIADLKKDKIETFFHERSGDVLTATHFYNIRRRLPIIIQHQNDPLNQEYRATIQELDEQMEPYLKLFGYHDIMFTDTHGIVVYTADESHKLLYLGKPIEDRQVFEHAKSGLTFSDVLHHGASSEKIIIIAAAPMKDLQDNFVGEVIFQIDLGVISNFIINTTGLGETGEVVLARREGNEALFLFPVKSDQAAALKLRVSIGGTNGSAIQNAVLGHSGSGTTNDYHGVQVLAAWRYIPSLRWGLVTKMDTSEAFEPIMSLRNIMIVIGSFLSIVGFLAALLAARSVTNPIKALQKGTEIISAGNLDFDVATKAKDEIGQFSRAFGLMTHRLKENVTEQERTAAELRKAREELEQRVQERTAELSKTVRALQMAGTYNRRLIEASLDPLVTIGPDGRITDVNEATAKITGCSRPELLGTDFVDYFTDPLKAQAGYQQVFREGTVRDYALEIRHKDGTKIPVLYNATVYRDDAGKVIGVFAAARDMTEHLKSEEMIQRTYDELEVRVQERTSDLNKAVEQLETVNRELNDFAYVVSHDLKAPLRAISTLASILANDYREKLDADGQEQLELLTGRVKRMYNLIEGILQYSRIGRVSEEAAENVDLNEVISQVIDLTSPPAHIRVIIDNQLPIISGDRTRLQQIFQNLIGNALKYMNKPQGEVHIGFTNDDGQMKFYVVDNGPGIEEKHFEKIFKIFQTLHPRDEIESTGIGLAIVKKIVEAYEGKIWVESTAGLGTTFYFTLRNKENVS